MTAHPRRFMQTHPCPVCGGHDGLARGRAVRCFGYLDGTGRYARCTREEHAGSLPQNRDGTYSHRLDGPCRCGQAHGDDPGTAGDPRLPPRTERRRAEQRFRSYFTLRGFLRRRYGEGAAIRSWIYRDAEGDEVFRVLRVDYRAADGAAAKSYRPCHRAADGQWLLSRPDTPLPLYNLPAILAAPPDAVIAVLEGEKCADIATAIGLPHATTSAHGARLRSSPTGRRWPGGPLPSSAMQDADGAGYAAQVAGLLAVLDPPARVQVVSLPGLADGEDIEQFVASRRDCRPHRRRHPRRAPRPDRSESLIHQSARPVPPFDSAPPGALFRDVTAAAGPVNHRLPLRNSHELQAAEPPSSPGCFVLTRRCARRDCRLSHGSQ